MIPYGHADPHTYALDLFTHLQPLQLSIQSSFCPWKRSVFEDWESDQCFWPWHRQIQPGRELGPEPNYLQSVGGRQERCNHGGGGKRGERKMGVLIVTREVKCAMRTWGGWLSLDVTDEEWGYVSEQQNKMAKNDNVLAVVVNPIRPPLYLLNRVTGWQGEATIH